MNTEGGATFGVACPSCGALNEPNATHCQACHYLLTTLTEISKRADAERLSSPRPPIQRYLLTIPVHILVALGFVILLNACVACLPIWLVLIWIRGAGVRIPSWVIKKYVQLWRHITGRILRPSHDTDSSQTAA